MTYRGHIKNGVAVLETPDKLPDGTVVRIEVERADSEFWQDKDTLELAAEQGVPVLTCVRELAGDWPPEDSIDEFLSLIREVRR